MKNKIKHIIRTNCRIRESRIEHIADKILALFPKAGEDGLLSPETIEDIFDKWANIDMYAMANGTDRPDITDSIKDFIKAQKALTDQQWIERAKEYICPECCTPGFVHFVVPIKVWQDIKERGE